MFTDVVFVIASLFILIYMGHRIYRYSFLYPNKNKKGNIVYNVSTALMAIIPKKSRLIFNCKSCLITDLQYHNYTGDEQFDRGI